MSKSGFGPCLFLALIGFFPLQSQALPQVTRLEVVTDKASKVPDANNTWGSQKLRIIRTQDGTIYTAYLFDDPSGNPLRKHWGLAMRGSDGAWQVKKFEGIAGRENVNLLRSPEGVVYVISWPDMIPTLLRKSVTDNEFAATTIPGGFEPSHWPYSSAGISKSGNLVVLQSRGSGKGNLKPGEFDIAVQRPGKGWSFRVVPTDFRYCYAYVFPKGDDVNLIAERDVKWETLGWPAPKGAFPYVFDGLKYFSITLQNLSAVKEIKIKEAEPNAEFPNVESYLTDAYEDINGAAHVLYNIRGPSTRGESQSHHAYLKNGKLLWDSQLPGKGQHYRVIQNPIGRFFFFDSSGGVLISKEKDGSSPKGPFPLNFKGKKILSNGLYFALPRNGNDLSDDADFVFATGDGSEWAYGRVRLAD